MRRSRRAAVRTGSPKTSLQRDFLERVESPLREVTALSEEGLVAEWAAGGTSALTKATPSSRGDAFRRQLGTPAHQAAYFADLERARTLQALGDRVGAAGYVERYLSPESR